MDYSRNNLDLPNKSLFFSSKKLFFISVPNDTLCYRDGNCGWGEYCDLSQSKCVQGNKIYDIEYYKKI